jgi:16S rRNA (adenine1518-N6/adenine1519-N6)-dimethyltransferase
LNALENLPPLREVIATYNLRAEKSLGQNFLFDLNITNKIACAAGDLTTCPVVEIGPGPGGLTRALLSQGAPKVYAIEFDPRAIEALQPLVQAAQGRLEIIHADALKVDLKTLAGHSKVKVVANLPYNIATALLIKWLDDYRLFDGLTLMFQREVAERLVAAPDTPAYGRLSVIVQWYMQGNIQFNLPASAFVPAPKVVSSVVRLMPRTQPFLDVAKPKLEKLLAIAFGQRRKMLRVTLKPLFPNVEETLLAQGIDPTRRAETLSLAEFGKVVTIL